ncbi:regulating synaptic membrane exocytosis protein 3 isoform X2 [Falco naumanni]|uniref:regulating synaptic membrane exocytosis protein 3 isoform X2 n=1 Tax=Falco naumanni TaxID=148594 RepID=UPI001ADEA2EB|nr:regulating synaptic membrane exocytosis protein 3 isoform X2 [Falco naumanni]
MFNGDASSSAARNVVRSSSISGEMYNIEKSARGSADSVTITASKKRRSSLGAKMVAIVGLSQWSKSTLQLNQTEGGPKKLRSNIRRSTETGIAVEMRTRVTRQGSRESTDGSTNSNSSDGTFIFPTTRLGAESQFSDFLDGLGPGQLVGRQTLATPPMGDVHVGMADRNGQLEVEVIQARGLIPKMGSKSIPATYVKVYLLENGICLAKKKTKVVKKTCDPSYQQPLLFEESPQGKVLQVTLPARISGDREGLGEHGQGTKTQHPHCCPSDRRLPTPMVARSFWPGTLGLPSFPQNSHLESGAAPLTPSLPCR